MLESLFRRRFIVLECFENFDHVENFSRRFSFVFQCFCSLYAMMPEMVVRKFSMVEYFKQAVEVF